MNFPDFSITPSFAAQMEGSTDIDDVAPRYATCIIRYMHQEQTIVQHAMIKASSTDNEHLFVAIDNLSSMPDDPEPIWYRLADGYARGLQIWRREGSFPCDDGCPFDWEYDAILTIVDLAPT